MNRDPWIGVDLDGTLAEYHGSMDWNEIGAPILPMVERVQKWLKGGKSVKVFTARASAWSEVGFDVVNRPIYEWCQRHIGQELPITCVKDFGMIELWDDRAVGVEHNTGKRYDRKKR